MPAEDAHPTSEFATASEDETGRVAARLAAIVRAGDVIALVGDLGAGKTAFARAFVNALPGDDEEVPSPTFTLVQAYDRGGLEVFHFDLYRLEAPDDAFELGIEDAFHAGVSLIEWPERLGPHLPGNRLAVEILSGDGPDRRLIRLSGPGDWPERLRRM